MNRSRLRAVIPMKPLAASKLRLSAVLDANRRAALSLWMLERVATAACAAPELGEVAIVGGDDRVQALSHRLGLTWQSDPAGDLNAALNAFYEASCQEEWEGILFLAGDLPEVSVADVEAVVAAFDGSDLVLVPGARGGTNALLLRCQRDFEFQLGGESYRRHRAQAERKRMLVESVHSEAIRADVDVPDDLARLEAIHPELWREVYHAAEARTLRRRERMTER